MSKCLDPKIAGLLHGYELDGLLEDEVELVEIHLLKCEHCFNELMSFERETALLTSDDDVRVQIREAAEEENSEPVSFLRRLWRYIWPEAPVVFRPVLAYLIILLMIFPVYHWIEHSREERIRPVQTIGLFPDRSSADDAFKISLGDDGLLSFVLRGASADESYRVVIQSDDGRVIFRDNAFNGFDEYETGRLLLPLSKMISGTYWLIITDLGAGSTPVSRRYSFSIQE
ncbi:MAG: hypothetical protein ABIK83_02590 [Candidatus Zixiibacteriota bacterium]